MTFLRQWGWAGGCMTALLSFAGIEEASYKRGQQWLQAEVGESLAGG